MRVAFDPSSTRGTKTGIGVYTQELIAALHRHAPEVQLAELEDSTGTDQRTDRRLVREQWAIPRLAKRAHPDLLHLTGFAVPLRAPCPVVITAMDLIGVLFAKNYPPPSRFYWSRYLPFTLRFAAQVIALSQNTKQDLVRLAKIPPERIHIIPPGHNPMYRTIDDMRALAQTRARLKLPQTFFLFVSTLEPRKGVDTLIEAYARIAGHISNDLVIVGKRGWYWDRFIAEVKKQGLESRIHFVDYIKSEDLPLVYNLASAFVFPSRYEGFGLTVLEAMACGTPVVSSNSSSLPEVIGEAGLLVGAGDIQGFAEAMARVASDSGLRSHLREQGLAQANRFSWERAARETVDVYRQLIK